MKRAQNDGYVWRGLVIYGDHILAYLTGPPKNRFSLGFNGSCGRDYQGTDLDDCYESGIPK
jgi:hypothetical protein